MADRDLRDKDNLRFYQRLRVEVVEILPKSFSLGEL
jgi:hypothetical protein